MKFRGVAETVLPADLCHYFQHMISTVLPSVPEKKLVVDRAQCLPCLSHLPENFPRDVIAKIHFFFTLKQTSCNLQEETLLYQTPIRVLHSSLTQHMIQTRKQLMPITKLLCNHHLIYQWRYPAKLLMTKDGSSHAVTSVEGGLCLA